MNNNKPVTQPAWDLFCKGDLAGAEQAASAAIPQLNSMAVHPIPDIMILKAFYMSRLNRHNEARALFGRVLGFSPDDAYAQEGYLLALKDELSATHKEMHNNDVTKGKLIIGIGTGRSGSTTLTKLLSHQADCYASHEHPPVMPWDFNQPRLDYQYRRFSLLFNYYDYVADVSHWWLPYLDTLLDTCKNIRIVALKRDRDDTVSSFIKIKGGVGKGAINHWIDHDGSFWSNNIWDECYPSYNLKNMQEALEMYWDDYYRSVDLLCKKYPESLKIYNTNDLGKVDTQMDILEHCGFSAPRAIDKLHLNKGGAKDGENLY